MRRLDAVHDLGADFLGLLGALQVAEGVRRIALARSDLHQVRVAGHGPGQVHRDPLGRGHAQLVQARHAHVHDGAVHDHLHLEPVGHTRERLIAERHVLAQVVAERDVGLARPS